MSSLGVYVLGSNDQLQLWITRGVVKGHAFTEVKDDISDLNYVMPLLARTTPSSLPRMGTFRTLGKLLGSMHLRLAISISRISSLVLSLAVRTT
eukprot:scaffold771_cov170-Amphora_coffeaeformis.AAC.20